MKHTGGSPKPPKTPSVAGFSPAAPLQRLLFKINPDQRRANTFVLTVIDNGSEAITIKSIG